MRYYNVNHDNNFYDYNKHYYGYYDYNNFNKHNSLPKMSHKCLYMFRTCSFNQMWGILARLFVYY